MAIDHLGMIAGRIKKYANNGLSSSEGMQEDNVDERDISWIDRIKDIPKGEVCVIMREFMLNLGKKV